MSVCVYVCVCACACVCSINHQTIHPCQKKVLEIGPWIRTVFKLVMFLFKFCLIFTLFYFRGAIYPETHLQIKDLVKTQILLLTTAASVAISATNQFEINLKSI